MNPPGELIEKRTCTQCRKSKVKCDKSNPCARCIRLGLNCVEQVRGRGRPLVSYMLRPVDVSGAPHEGLMPYDPEQGQWNFSVAFNNPEATQPVIQDFFRDEGRLKLINRRKLLIVLRSWGLTARSKKTQAFFKTVQSVAATFHLELQDILNMEPEVYRELCGGDERKTWAFNPVELPLFINALDCDASAVSKRIVIDGESRYYNNEMFSSLFHTLEDADLMFERSTGYDVWLSCVENEDKKEFYEACLSSMLLQPSMSSETCKVFKCKDKNGRTFLGVVRMRSMFFSAGDYVGYAFSITPIPNSKYFSPVSSNSQPGITASTMEPLSSAARLRAFVDLSAPLTVAPMHPVPSARPSLDSTSPPLAPPPVTAAYPYHTQAIPPKTPHMHRAAYPVGVNIPGGGAKEEMRWAPALMGPQPGNGGHISPQHMAGPPGMLGGPGGMPPGMPQGMPQGMPHMQPPLQPPGGNVGNKRPREDPLESDAERSIAATLQRMYQPAVSQGMPHSMSSSAPPTPMVSSPPSPAQATCGNTSHSASGYTNSLGLLGGAATAASTGGHPGPGVSKAASTLAQYLRSSATPTPVIPGGNMRTGQGQGQGQGMMAPQGQAAHPPMSESDMYNTARPASPAAKVITQV